MKKNEIQNNVMVTNKATSKNDHNMSNTSHSYEEKLRAKQEKIIQLEVK